MDVKLPPLGEGAESGVVVNVFVKPGDAIAKDQPVLELENEKAVAAVPSTLAGTVTQVYVKVGDKVGVGARLIAVGSAGASEAPASAAGPEAEAEPAAAAEPPPAAPEAGSEPAEEAVPAPSAEPGVVPAASPSIRRLAAELGLDLARVRGTARGGRIVMADVKAYVQRLQRLVFETKAAPAAPAKAPEIVDFAKWGPISTKPLTPLRRTISRRLSENWVATPLVTQFDTADITELNDLRKRVAPAYEQKGVRLTVTTFLLRALVQTLQKHPLLNASLDEAADQLVLKAYYHIGIAVDTDAGLIVPVIRDVDRKNLVELSRDLEVLATKARERKVTADELKGGTFTLSNQGGIGGGHFTPLVNRPEVAILGVGRGTVTPVWRENQVQPRLRLPLALSYDHRVIDGANAARFIVDLVQAIEGITENDAKL